MADTRLPVTVLSKFPGAKKTTLLHRLINNREGHRVAVIARDMSDVNIDADLVRADTELCRTDETLVEMSNGCICCTLRDDLLEEVRRPSDEGRFDYLLIGFTVISEPLPVAATFNFHDENGDSLSDVSRLDTMVTVVDAVNLLEDDTSQNFLSDRRETMGDGDDRTLVGLLVEQIEFADVVILNKVDDAGQKHRGAERQIIRSLNADAKIFEPNHSDIASDVVLDTGLFDFEMAHGQALYGFGDYVPETDEYGVASYVYRARRPFDPERIHNVLDGDLQGAKRKIATRPTWRAEVSLAGNLTPVKPLATWWPAVPQDNWPTYEGARAYMASHWQEPWGDRRQKPVFIGAGIDWAALKTTLYSCLVPEHRALGPDALPDLPDPFQPWPRAEEAAVGGLHVSDE